MDFPNHASWERGFRRAGCRSILPHIFMVMSWQKPFSYNMKITFLGFEIFFKATEFLAEQIGLLFFLEI